ncbi:MAG: D-alanyl-D-alanine carboxypeptidase [Lachnospiraceae bacterium]|nr:D-alanyl-D-alanine carboxypeptidase [Lachnospiraceae bacterium]
MSRLYRYAAKFMTLALILSMVCALPVSATADTEDEVQARYNKTIESDSWENWPAGPQVYAESAIVMEASTGVILYAKSIDEQHYPASITKIMTVLLALENLELDEEVTFSHTAVYTVEAGSSSIARDEGEILTVEECLYAIMLESANECANAIAEQVSGSIDAFVDLMNERAAELGCTGTHFTNANGLPDEEHYTTSHDMALITQEAIKYEEFRKISVTARYTLRATNKKEEELVMNNHHYMISGNVSTSYLDDTVFAGKTGYTVAAQNTLVTCATRNGMDLIVVTMQTQGTSETGVPVYTDTANLLDYATENFQKVNISENETNFTIGQSDLFDTGASIFGTSSPIIEMDSEGYAVLPVTVSLSDADASLTFLEDQEDDVIATLSYTYANQTVGSTELYQTGSSLQEFAFGSLSADEATESGADTTQRLIRIDLRIVGLIAAILLFLLILILLLRKIKKEYSISFRFFSKWKQKRQERRQFGNPGRRRYKSRKRKNRRLFK